MSILANIFFRPDIARRKLQADFEGKPDLMTATVLAFLGDATGRAFIQNAIAKASWTHGWQYENTPDATVHSSPLEALLMALRNIGGAQTAAYTKLCILTADNPLSNIRALALFFIRWPSSAAARDWERILDDTSLRLDIPLSLARCQAESLSQPRYHDILNRHMKRLFAAAALFACQPLSLKARQLLEKYRACPNYHMAIFAMHILKN